ncbi:RNA polymerase Rpb4-domain-containing protein [Rhizoctonia solani]|nr:RNA polymerase Rpb4-domain-containing protein [Rhizoctonia solani]
MEIVAKNSALVSNYEVLTLLRELESNQLAKARSHLAAKKEEEGASLNGHPVPPVAGNPIQDEVPQNLRTIEVELITHLKDMYPLMQRQNDTAIRNLTRSLGKFALTKSEKLQIVNLAPRQLVELYVVVENLEERFTDDQLTEMLQLVEQSFLIAPTSALEGDQTTRAALVTNKAANSKTSGDTEATWDADEGDGMENYFVHDAPGGQDDLEMDDTEE